MVINGDYIELVKVGQHLRYLATNTTKVNIHIGDGYLFIVLNIA